MQIKRLLLEISCYDAPMTSNKAAKRPNEKAAVLKCFRLRYKVTTHFKNFSVSRMSNNMVRMQRAVNLAVTCLVTKQGKPAFPAAPAS